MATMHATLRYARPWTIAAAHADLPEGKKDFASVSEAAGWLMARGFKFVDESMKDGVKVKNFVATFDGA